MEGVGFAIKEALSHMPSHASTYVLAGGITYSPVWCQILADILDHPVETPTNDSSYGCIGVGILAGMGVGHFDSDNPYIKQTERTTYFPTASEAYDAPYQQYLRLYHYMKSKG